MEEYLQYMRNLRSQMNDVEDQAAKTSVEEQTLIITIQTLEKDLQSEKAEAKKLEGDTELMIKAKAQICTQIAESQRKIASLESDSSTLVQTVELLQQEKIAAAAKLAEKRSYYYEISKDVAAKFQDQQEWIDTHNPVSESGTASLSTEANNSLRSNLDSAESELNKLVQLRSELLLSINKMKESIECATRTINNFPPEIRDMDMETLRAEYEALLSDKSQESEYLSSVHQQIQKIKGLSETVTCACGQEFKVEMGASA